MDSARKMAVSAKYASLSPKISEEQHELGQVPLLAETLEIDDKDVTVVFVFPRSDDDGGVVDAEAERQNPKECAERIFYRQAEYYPDHFKIFDQLGDESVDEGQYQDLVRAEFVSLLQYGGLRATSSPSIDGDEVFLKVSLDPSKRLVEVASHYGYRMPISEEAEKYKMKINAEGVRVPAYTECAVEKAPYLEGFTNIDEIRLIYRWLLERVSLDEMRKQGIIISHFPAGRYDEITRLNKDWASIRLALCMHARRDAELVRTYFGERIGFFFAWFAEYNKYLIILASASMIAFVIKKDPDIHDRWKSWIKNAFAVFLVGWVASFNELFKRRSARLKQRWGMKDWENSQAVSIPSYKEHMDGTWKGALYKTVSSSVVVLYLLFFAGMIFFISYVDKGMREQGDMRLADWSPLIISILMKVSSFAWGKIAPSLVRLQNHRTDSRYTDALAANLATVKLFVALFPFCQLAFIEGTVNQRCADTLEQAAKLVFVAGFPEGTPLQGTVPSDHANYTATSLSFVQPFSHTNSYGKVCISGCYPDKCWMAQAPYGRGSSGLVCSDTCWSNLKEQLATFYTLQLGMSLLFLFIPIALTKVTVTLEIAKVIGYQNTIGAICQSLMGRKLPTSADSDSSSADYSFLQFQAKCSTIAAYEYNSWGGSFVEDFLDLTIGYSLLACFSQVLPRMACFGFVAHMLQYRILAYRMTNVTCRPLPDGAEGIGIWQPILDTIATLAVTCNVALATWCQEPIKHWRRDHQLLFFILAEKTLFSIRGMVGAIWTDEPDDVVRIEDYNAAVVTDLNSQSLPWALKMQDYSRVDIALTSAGSDEETMGLSGNGAAEPRIGAGTLAQPSMDPRALQFQRR